MDTTNQITEDGISRLGAAYASICLERPAFLSRLTDWTGEKAARLLEARERLLAEFDLSGGTTLDDLIGVELARFYKALDGGSPDTAVEFLYRIAAVAFRAARSIKMSNPAEEEHARVVDTSEQG